MGITMKRSPLFSLAIVTGLACGGGEGDGGTEPPPPPSVATVTITPSLDTILIRDHEGFAVVVRDSGGAVMTGKTVTWGVSDPTLAHHSGGGTFFADQVGTVQMIATVDGVSDTATVLLAPVVTVGRRFPSLFLGDTTRLTAALTDVFATPVTGPAPAWSSADTSIATVSSIGVVTAKVAGLVAIRAASSGGLDSQVVAVLAPRIGVNRELIFSHDTSSPTAIGFSELWRSNPDGGGALRLTPQDYSAQVARWSPDGSRIVFSGGQVVGQVGTLALHTMNFDGSNLVPLAGPGLLPAWSPDGTRLAVHNGSTANIAVMNSDGTNATSLPTGAGTDTWPAWSPDGRQIAWRKDVGGGGCNEVWLMDASGANQRKLPLPAGIQPCQLAWSPDGKELALEANGGIWLVGVDGSAFRPLSPNCTLPAACTAPVYTGVKWNHAATRLAFSGAESGSQGSVNVIGRDGTGFVTATFFTGGNSTYPDWSPDDTRLAFQAFDPADTTGSTFPLVIVTSDPNVQNLQYGRPGVWAAGPRWRP